jgi:hypothetical protein
MNVMMDTTRGFERSDPAWHCNLESVDSAEEILRLVREYIATLGPDELVRLPDPCRVLRVKAEDDIEYWTFRLSQRPHDDDCLIDGVLLQDIFNHFLHASLRLSQIRKAMAEALAPAREH